MQNWGKVMHLEQENGLEPHFGPFLALNGPFLGQINFFSKIGLRHFSTLIEGWGGVQGQVSVFSDFQLML